MVVIVVAEGLENEPKPLNPVDPKPPVVVVVVVVVAALPAGWLAPNEKDPVDVAGVCPKPVGADEVAPNVFPAADFWPKPPKPPFS